MNRRSSVLIARASDGCEATVVAFRYYANIDNIADAREDRPSAQLRVTQGRTTASTNFTSALHPFTVFTCGGGSRTGRRWRRIAQAADYTGHYVLLASYENSSSATGSIINCDGGIGIRGFDRPAGGGDL